MAQIKVTQVQSLIDRPVYQKKVIQALGLGKIGKTKTFESTPAIQGMVRKVAHLLKVEEQQ